MNEPDINVISPESAEQSLREAIDAPPVEATPVKDKSEPVSQQTATTETKDSPKQTTSDSKTDDTRAASENKEATPVKNEQQKVEKEETGKKKSDYAKDNERREKTWKSINERKVALDADEARIKSYEAKILAKENEIKLAEAQAKNRFTPDQYEKAATDKLSECEQLSKRADALDAEAEKHDEESEYGKAELARNKAKEIRDQVIGEKHSAKQLKLMADNLRNNPDPTIEQLQQKIEQTKKFYLLEAAKLWPDVAKKDSEFQKQMVVHLQAAEKQGIDINKAPALYYHIARLTAAEAAAARVPTLEKELQEKQARIKEFEKMYAPGGGKTAAQSQLQPVEKDFAKMSLPEQEAWLRRNQ